MNNKIKEQYKIIAHIWYCGDNLCECYQAKISISNDDTVYGMNIWEGEFHSGDCRFIEDAQKELEEAAVKYNISLEKYGDFGERIITKVEYEELKNE